MCREDSEELGADLKFDRCTVVGGFFQTTLFLLFRLHSGVCCRDIRDIFGSEGNELLKGVL